MSDLPATMNAIEIAEPGGPEALKLVQQPLPPVTTGEILIKVAAAGVNRADIMQRRGFYPPPEGAPNTPGLEAAGSVAALGAGVSGFAVGDDVCCLLAGGGYAEYCVAPALQVLPVPKGLSMVEAGAVPETFFTVWTNVFDQAGLKAGERFLVHGGSSGIGTTAIQLARAFGAEAYATAGSLEKCAACEKLGAKRAINYHDEDFVAVIKEATGGEGVNVILDIVGGEYVQRNFQALSVEGRLVNIALMGGAKAEVNLGPFMIKRLTFSGSTLRARSVEAKGEIAANLRQRVWPLLEDGTIKSIVDSTFPLANASKAHERMESSAHIGKIVLTMT